MVRHRHRVGEVHLVRLLAVLRLGHTRGSETWTCVQHLLSVCVAGVSGRTSFSISFLSLYSSSVASSLSLEIQDSGLAEGLHFENYCKFLRIIITTE